jgi:SAM-dependent methyltransferase
MSEDLFDEPDWKDSAILASQADDETRRFSGERRDTALASDAPCPVCEGRNVSKHRNNLSRCLRCHHIFQTDLRVSAVYDAEYARQYDVRPHREMSALRWNFIQRWLRLAAGSRILDIGYGNGSFLKYVRQHGMEVYGLDVHGEDFGIPTVTYEAASNFDLICFFDSLEHFPKFDPLFALHTSNVIVSLPNSPDFLLDAPQHWRHYKPGEHLHYFSYDSLDRLMHKWGLTVKIVEGLPEDDLRGKLTIGSRAYDNIHTAIYGKGQRP